VDRVFVIDWRVGCDDGVTRTHDVPASLDLDAILVLFDLFNGRF
jgi:hypothetical protein